MIPSARCSFVVSGVTSREAQDCGRTTCQVEIPAPPASQCRARAQGPSIPQRRTGKWTSDCARRRRKRKEGKAGVQCRAAWPVWSGPCSGHSVRPVCDRWPSRDWSWCPGWCLRILEQATVLVTLLGMKRTSVSSFPHCVYYRILLTASQ